MKLCVDCGTPFKPKGRQKLCGACKDEERQLQKADEKENPRKETVRPIDRINRRVVFQGQSGIIRR